MWKSDDRHDAEAHAPVRAPASRILPRVIAREAAYILVEYSEKIAVRGAKSHDMRCMILVVFVFCFGLLTNHRGENQDAFLSLLDAPAQLIPRTETGYVTGIRFLQNDQQHVVQTECELPDYVNWRKKTKVPCILLRSRVNIVRAISRTSAICE